MDRETAINELRRLDGLKKAELFAGHPEHYRGIGTPELRERFYWLDALHERFPDFNPVKLIAIEEQGGYSWHLTALFRNANHSFSVVYGSGCSCGGPGSRAQVIFYPQVDDALNYLKHEMEYGSYTESARVVYRDTLVWVATRRVVAK